MDSLSRSAYSDAFTHDSPARVGQLLRGRLQAGREINERLAEYFSERAELEEAYAASLQRALSKLKTGKLALSIKDNPGLGNGSTRALERVIEHETTKVANLHGSFAKRCREQMEVPLRNRVNREDWTAVVKQDRQTESLLKEIEEAQGKVAKAQAKGKKSADKIPGLVQAQSQAESNWASHLPSYLGAYQQLDYARLNTLKELLTSFETLQNDLGRERLETAERGLEACLMWEVEQELTEFVSKEGFRGGSGNAGARGPPPTRAVPPSVSVTNNNNNNNYNNEDAPNRPRAGTMTSSRSFNNGRPESIMTNSGRQGDGSTPQKSGGGLLSAFRGGKIDRRKSTSQPQNPVSMSSAGAGAGGRQSSNNDSGEERETLGASMGSSGGRPSTTSRDRQQSFRSNGSSNDEFGQQDNASNAGSGSGSGSLRPSAGTGRKSNRDSFLPSFSSLGLKRRGTSANNVNTSSMAQIRDEDDLSPGGYGSGAPRTAPAGSGGFGGGSDMDTPPAVPPPNTSRSLNPFDAMSGNNNNRPTSQASDATNRPVNQGNFEQVSMFGNEGPGSASVDAQGFSIPPADYKRPAWETSNSGSGNNGGNLMDMPDSDDENDNHANMRVSIAPASAVKQEDEADREAAMLRMKNTLLSTGGGGLGAPGGSSGINRRATRIAGRGSRQSTLLGAGGAGSGGGGMMTPPQASPAASNDDIPIQTISDMHRHKAANGDNVVDSRSRTETAGSTPGTALASPSEFLASPTAPSLPRPPPPPPPARAGSMLSTSSSQQNLAAAGMASSSPFENPSAPGFRAAIVETVNVLFKAGQVQRVMITGEILLSLRDTNVRNGEDLRIRLANFGQYEKSAPNHAVLSSSGSVGEYRLNISALQNAQTSSPTTVFKYQLRMQEGLDSKAFVPIEVHPQWKIEQGQTSFLMTYHGNPYCQFSSAEASPFGDDDSTATGGSPAVLHDVSFSVPITSSGVTNLQTKPQGSYSTEKKRLQWKMDDLDISSNRAAKVLARFATSDSDGAEGTMGQPGPVSVQWKLPGRLASGTSLEVEGMQLDEVVRITQSGKYMAQP